MFYSIRQVNEVTRVTHLQGAVINIYNTVSQKVDHPTDSDNFVKT